MTFYEFYKDELERIYESGKDITVVNDKPCSCLGVSICSKCIRKYECSLLPLLEWCASEYHPPKDLIKITEKQKHFLTSLGDGFLVKDERGRLHYSKDGKYYTADLGSIEYLIGDLNFINKSDVMYSIKDVLADAEVVEE